MTAAISDHVDLITADATFSLQHQPMRMPWRLLGRPALWIGLLGIYLLATAAGKAADFSGFSRAVSGYRLVADSSAGTVARVVLAIGGALLIPHFQRRAAQAAIVLLLLFAGVLSASLLNGQDIDCGCSLPFATGLTISWGLVAKNMALAFVLLGLLLADAYRGMRLRDCLQAIGAQASSILACIVFVVMALTIMNLKQANGLLMTQMTGPAPLQVGETVPPLAVRQLAGAEEEIRYAGVERTVLFIFSPTCPYCERIIPWWNEQCQIGAKEVRRLGISLGSKEDTEQFLKERKVQFPVYLPIDRDHFVQHYKVVGFPQTTEIASDGSVAGNVQGLPKGLADEGSEQATAAPIGRILR